MITDFIIKLFRSPYGKIFGILILLIGAYNVGALSERIEIAKKEKLIGKSLDVVKKENNKEIDGLNTKFAEDGYNGLEILQGNLSKVDYFTELLNNGTFDYSVSVVTEQCPDQTQGNRDKAVDTVKEQPAKQPVHSGKLSEEALGFSRGEARRADYCAVLLEEAVRENQSIRQQVSQYNDLLKKRGVLEKQLIDLK